MTVLRISIKKQIGAFILLGLLVAIAYSSSYTASWHVDDIPRIVRNPQIHLTTIDAQSLQNTFFTGAAGRLYRPLPMASFALNWYFNGASPVGYRVVNTLIHAINAALLYLVSLNLLQTPRLAGRYSPAAIHWIALLASVLWALNPIQTQAVTYIVQRMTAMAALFYLAGMVLFLRYKQAASTASRTAHLAAILLCYLLSILSKENTILFPLTVGLIQIGFYSVSEPDRYVRKRWLFAVALITATLIVGGAFFFIERGNPIQFLERLYLDRPFTPMQRLATEFRIVLMYLSQIFLPIPSRLSFCHDIAVSTSLIKPWTTLPAMVIVLSMVTWAAAQLRRFPLLGLAILFFFLNHVVESTILPLELVFEHRNYLPSAFLFLPLAAGIVVFIQRRPAGAGKYQQQLVVAIVVAVVGVICSWTFARNITWYTQRSLWEDEIAKHPELARPYHNLAWGHYQARGKYDEALTLYQKALERKARTPFEVASTLNNIGRIYYLKADYERALGYFEESKSKHPQPEIAAYQIAMTLIQLERWPTAEEIIDAALEQNQSDPFYLKLKGIVLLHQEDPEGAAAAFSRSLQQRPATVDTRAHLGIVLGRMARYDEALMLLAANGYGEPGSLHHFLAVCEIERTRGNPGEGDRVFGRMIQRYGAERVREQLTAWKDDKLAIDIDYAYFLAQLARYDSNQIGRQQND